MLQLTVAPVNTGAQLLARPGSAAPATTPLMSALVKLVQLSVLYWMLAAVSLAPVKFVPLRLAPPKVVGIPALDEMVAPWKLALVRLAPIKLTPLIVELLKLALERFAPVRLRPVSCWFA